jgi:hypothetical protein
VFEEGGTVLHGRMAELLAQLLGMIIGENAKLQDLEVNAQKSKQLTNFRASGKDEGIRLTPPRRMTLEQAIAYIQDDELAEVTPQSVRLRKRYLDTHERKKMARRRGRGGSHPRSAAELTAISCVSRTAFDRRTRYRQAGRGIADRRFRSSRERSCLPNR